MTCVPHAHGQTPLIRRRATPRRQIKEQLKATRHEKTKRAPATHCQNRQDTKAAPPLAGYAIGVRPDEALDAMREAGPGGVFGSAPRDNTTRPRRRSRLGSTIRPSPLRGYEPRRGPLWPSSEASIAVAATHAPRLIQANYAEAANAIAETLTRLETIERELRTVNARLRSDVGYVEIEAFRGHRATRGEMVVLPGVTSDDADFWPTRPRFRRLAINELYARN